MSTKTDTRILCEIKDSELEDIFREEAVENQGHCSVKSFINDGDLWGMTVEEALASLNS